MEGPVEPVMIFALSLIAYVYSFIALLSYTLPSPLALTVLLVAVIGMLGSFCMESSKPATDTLPLPPPEEWMRKARHCQVMVRCLAGLAALDVALAALASRI